MTVQTFTGTGAPDEYAVVLVRRDAQAGGTPGYVNAGLRAETVTNTGTTSFEWAVLGILNNYATDGENVAVYGQANKHAGAGPTWAGCFEARDHSGSSNELNGLVGVEVDVFANGQDKYGERIGIDLVFGKGVPTGETCQAGYGIRLGPQNGDATNGSVIYGIEMSKLPISKAALHVAPGVPIQFGNDTLSMDGKGNVIVNGTKINLVRMAKLAGCVVK